MAPYILACIALALSLGAALAAYITMHLTRGLRERCDSLEDSVAAIRRELELVASISVRTGRRVQRVEHEFSGVAERVDLVETRSALAATGLGAMDQAIDLAKRGARPDLLAEQFGLSSGEAELVARLHGRAQQG